MRLVATLLFGLVACNKGFTPIADAEAGGGADLGVVERSVADHHTSGSEGGTLDGTAVPTCPGPVVSEDIDTFHDPGEHTSIAVDSKGDLHISNLGAGEPFDLLGNGGWWDARYSVRRSGTWQSEDIATSGVVGSFSAIGVAPSGEVHVVFYKDGDRDLIYSHRDATGWKLPQAILSDGDGGWGNDLAVDDSGTVHAVTFSRPSSGQDQVAYLRRVGAAWEAAVVVEASAFDSGPKSGLAVQPDGTVHLSLQDASGKLKYRRGKDGVFQAAQILDSGLGAGATDIAVDGTGDAQIAYYDGTAKVLKFIGQQSGIFGAPMTLDSSGVVGSYHAIAASAGGDLWIAYYDFTNQDLRVIRRQGGSWGPPQTVDSAGHVGRYCSAALGSDGALHVAHWNVTTRALRHTRVCP
jgi:hypothetical protein